MRYLLTTAAACLLAVSPAAAQFGASQPAQQPPPATQQPPTTQQPAPGTTTPAPGTTAPQAPGTVPQQPAPTGPPAVVPPPTVAPVLTASRTFTAPTGMIFQSVRPDRTLDFETVIGLLTDALKKSTDPGLQAQAKGWRVFKAVEPGPNNTVLYVFVIDPAVTGADYGLGRVLADAYPDKIQEIWKLYQNSVAPSATLLNLMPIEGPPKPVPGATPVTPGIGAPTTTTPPAPARPAPPPPDAGSVVR